MAHSRKKLNLLGQRYGRLVVIATAENIGWRTAWLCRCDCGRQLVVKTYHLRSGHVTSCGCARAGGFDERLHYLEGTCVEMLRAKTVRCNNTSGVPGVDWLAARGRWRATICFKGRRYFLGSFEQFAEAVQARKQAEAALHDEFVRNYVTKNSQIEENNLEENNLIDKK